MKEELWAWWEFSWETLPLPVAALFIQEITLSNTVAEKGVGGSGKRNSQTSSQVSQPGNPHQRVVFCVCGGGGRPQIRPPAGCLPGPCRLGRARPTGPKSSSEGRLLLLPLSNKCLAEGVADCWVFL